MKVEYYGIDNGANTNYLEWDSITDTVSTTENVEIAGFASATAYWSGANQGQTYTVVVKGSDGNNCNLVFTDGLLTSDTCP